MELTNNDNLKLIISDIDGTLLEYVTLQELVAEAISSFNIPLKEEYFNMQVLGVVDAMKEAENYPVFNFDRLCYYWGKHFLFLKDFNIKVEDISRKMLELETKYSVIIPHVDETLQVLQNDYDRLICSTNWLLSSQEKKLEAMGIIDYFNKIYTCEGSS